ncbi:MAG: Blue-light-activated histidine kinase [Syntrophorhabdus sp. PtaB.Bin006]|nr:MAG: Blue-light-activated histidine kinase [Syntrophorhabdus sp. PtaB.Bin006]
MEETESVNAQPEDLLQGSENFFYLIAEHVPALIAYVDAEDLRYRFVNKHYEEFFEKPREAIIGKQVRETIGEENYRFALPYIEGALSGKVTSYENIFVTPRGKSWLKVNYAPDVDKSGTVKGIFVLKVDMTEHKRAEKALQESEQKFKDLSEKSIAGVYVIQDDTLKYVNLIFARIFGYEVDEMIGKVAIEDVIFPEDWPAVKENVRKSISGELESLHYEFRIITKNKEVKNVEVYSSRTIYGAKPAVIGTCLDITTRKQAEAAIEKYSNDLKERVKELNCLYSISEIVRRNDIPRKKVFQECALTLSRAYLFPEITVCRITWDGHEYSTKNFKKTKWLQNHAIMVHGEQAGTIEVCYLEERQEEYEGPFLAEERQLLSSVADLLGRSEERKQAEEEREKLISELQEAFAKVRT